MPRRIAFVLVWLALTAEIAGDTFGGKWETPLTWLGSALFTPLPGIKFPLWDLAVFATLAWALTLKGARKDLARPLMTSLVVTYASLAALWVWGVIRGGDIRQTTWQLHGFVMAFVTAQLLIATCRTLPHLVTLGKVIVFATLYRAIILLVFYFAIARGLYPPLATLTSHADTALFVTGLLMLLAYALEKGKSRAMLISAVCGLPIALAIHYNNRRLAWLSLAIGIAMTYLLMPKSKLKRRINLALMVGAPLLLMYIAVGWGRTEGIFKPVGAISTMMGTHEDASSETRNIENYNLVMTLKSSPILGLGWGHEYQEVSVAYSIKEIFEQYRYLPHNSVLGLLAFTGLIGFTGVWQVFVVSAFLLARVQRLAADARARTAALIALLGMMVFVLQAWGDMGLGTLTSDVLLGSCFAVAARVPVLTSVWSPKARINEQKRKHVDDHEHAESDQGLAEPTLGEPITSKENR